MTRAAPEGGPSKREAPERSGALALAAVARDLDGRLPDKCEDDTHKRRRFSKRGIRNRTRLARYVVNPVGPGHLVLWPEGGARSDVSTLIAGQTVANAAVVPLSVSGGISMVLGVSGGDVILDTNGYYSPLGVVNSLNGQAGDLTLVAGTNVTLTPGTGTLSISAASGTGPQGPQGGTGATGATGSQGPIGLTGPTGTRGATGAQGPIGLTGNQGNQGFVGPQGIQGLTGPIGLTGSTGASGVNSPLVFGPYNSSSTDTSGCPTGPVNADGAVYWADDTFTRTYIVTPRSDRSFDVTELFNGTFTTIASGSPTDCSVLLPAGITGQFYGDMAFGTPSGLDFNFTATCPAGCTGTQFFNTFFNTTPPGSGYAWQFHYATLSNGTWHNTDHGNTGSIFP